MFRKTGPFDKNKETHAGRKARDIQAYACMSLIP